MNENKTFEQMRKYPGCLDVTEEKFKEAVFAIFPHFLRDKYIKQVYRLHPYGLMGGGYSICYMNPELGSPLLQEFSDDPIDAIKFTRHNLHKHLLWVEEITEEEYEMGLKSGREELCEKKDNCEKDTGN
jgi:hypothetical protein